MYMDMVLILQSINILNQVDQLTVLLWKVAGIAYYEYANPQCIKKLQL